LLVFNVPLFAVENGNTTVYEWRYGEPPLRIEEPPLLIDTDEAPSTGSDDAVSTHFHSQIK
jgi:hypothetical protein